jgi:hypothetical protein
MSSVADVRPTPMSWRRDTTPDAGDEVMRVGDSLLRYCLYS